MEHDVPIEMSNAKASDVVEQASHGTISQCATVKLAFEPPKEHHMALVRTCCQEKELLGGVHTHHESIEHSTHCQTPVSLALC